MLKGRAKEEEELFFLSINIKELFFLRANHAFTVDSTRRVTPCHKPCPY
jgi:hypothetical protein